MVGSRGKEAWLNSMSADEREQQQQIAAAAEGASAAEVADGNGGGGKSNGGAKKLPSSGDEELATLSREMRESWDSFWQGQEHDSCHVNAFI